MKPNDKALDEALSVTQIPEENMREYMRRVLTAAYAAQFKSEDYAGLVKDLRAFDEELLNAQPHSCEQTAKQAADALEALLADRDALKAENNELREENENIQAANRYGKDWVDQASQDIASLRAERDALAARLAPVDDDSRHLTTEEQKVFNSALRRSAKIKKPVDDKALVEIAARTIVKENVYKETQIPSKTLARAAIAAIRPHIEAAERERCAAALEITSDEIRLHAGEMTAQEMRSVLAVLAWRAEAIRRGE